MFRFTLDIKRLIGRRFDEPCGFWYEELAFSGNKWMGIILSAAWLISDVYLFELIFSLILFTVEVVDDSGRPKFQVQFKGETKSFFPEEVSPFGQLASSSVSQSANRPTRLYGLDTRSYLAKLINFSLIPLQNSTNRLLASASITLLAGRTTFFKCWNTLWQLWAWPLLIYVQILGFQSGFCNKEMKFNSAKPTRTGCKWPRETQRKSDICTFDCLIRVMNTFSSMNAQLPQGEGCLGYLKPYGWRLKSRVLLRKSPGKVVYIL